MSKGAGILFLSKDNTALFLQRGPTAPDFPGHWDFPGGSQEGDETADETARREAREEVGWFPARSMVLHTRSPGPIDFTTYLMRVDTEFTPELSDEHTGHSWAPVASPPEPLHPGCRVALARMSMDELGVARAIAAGELTSPQHFVNHWMFAIRITGTGVAYRSKYDEFVHRSPDHYLNEEFLARCNGLPVIWKHPRGAVLNSDEFAKRIVGTILLPYIDGDEVWGIARIWDESTAKAMADGKINSTSPTVYFDDPEVNTTLVTEGGRKVLIEGKPALLDHVAICELGVWDKMGPPAGIRAEAREDEQMAGEDEKAKEDAKKADAAAADSKADAKADADAGTKLDKLLSYCDSMSDSQKKMDSRMDAMTAACDALTKRMDEWEKKGEEKEDSKKKDDSKKDDSKADAKKADAAKKDNTEGDLSESEKEKAKEDKAKKDADEKEKEEEKAKDDAKKRDDAQATAVADLMKRIDDQGRELEALRRAGTMADEDRFAVYDAQARADDVFQLANQRAPVPQPGETKSLYERRVARKLQEHSGRWAGFKLSEQAFADDANFGKVYEDILADARKKFSDSDFAGASRLRGVKRVTEGGHTIIDYQGDPGSWMDPLAGAARQYVTRFNTKRES